MALWVRFRAAATGRTGIGRLDGGRIAVHEGPLFGSSSGSPAPTGEYHERGDVAILTPCTPSKMIALWNNYRALAEEKSLEAPQTPLYLFKPPNTWLAHGQTIRHPAAYDGEVFYEGELGIVIGREAADLSPQDAAGAIFGYTCINDVTAFGLLKEYPGFDQWSRAKGFDTFGVFGPAIATGLDYRNLEIVTRVNGAEVQRYPASDMILPPPEIVAALSRNMTLLPGDVICCGTSVGLGPMPRGSRVAVEIEGIGSLENPYE